jgi:hypothetical protein
MSGRPPPPPYNPNATSVRHRTRAQCCCLSRTYCAPAGSSSVQQPCGPADSLNVADPNPYCATTCIQSECQYSIRGMHLNSMPSLFSPSPHCPTLPAVWPTKWSFERCPINAPLTVRAQVPMAQPVSVNNMGGGGHGGGGGYGGGYGGGGPGGGGYGPAGGGYGGSDVTVQVSFAFITMQSLVTLTLNPAGGACNERKP